MHLQVHSLIGFYYLPINPKEVSPKSGSPKMQMDQFRWACTTGPHGEVTTHAIQKRQRTNWKAKENIYRHCFCTYFFSHTFFISQEILCFPIINHFSFYVSLVFNTKKKKKQISKRKLPLITKHQKNDTAMNNLLLLGYFS